LIINFKDGDLFKGDCLEIMKEIPDQSVDMILCDLPYGTTACSWDTVIPFEPLWEHYWRVLKPNKSVLLFGAEPFSSMLRMSQIDKFKYDWIWCKSRALGFTNAKNKPMNKHETISVFSQGTVANKSTRKMLYNPQDLKPSGKKVSGIKDCKADKTGHKFARKSHKEEYIQEYTNYPVSTLSIPNEGKTIHPTQKPVALLEYLIKTYTNEGDVILDNCIGSGTTALAALNTRRKFIGIELNDNYFDVSNKRIEEWYNVSI